MAASRRPSKSSASSHKTAAGKRIGAARVGISGWRYVPWRGTFYPKDLVQKKELEFASRHLNSIEINGSFYALQRPQSYAAWYEQTPSDFVFSVKAPRFITHIRRLRDVATPLANFFASGVLRLNEKLGPVLWQFPPSLKFDANLFDAFFKLLPRDTHAAVSVARQHDAHMTARAWLSTDTLRPIRYAVEVRHESFKVPEYIALLRKHSVALVFADTAGKWPVMEDVTADFIYARLHGDSELYVSGYTDEALDRWAARFTAWRTGSQPADARLTDPKTPPARSSLRDLYIYFDNDVKVRAPFDAQGLARRLGVRTDSEEQLSPPAKFKKPPQARRHWPGVRKSSPKKE